MILNHESPAGRIKLIVVKSLHLEFAIFVLSSFLLAHRVLNNIGKNRYGKTPQQYSDHYFPWGLLVKASADKPVLIILPIGFQFGMCFICKFKHPFQNEHSVLSYEDYVPKRSQK